MRETLILGGKLLLISVVAALALGFTNAVTKGPIAEQQILAEDQARAEVLPVAKSFSECNDAAEGFTIYEGRDASGKTVGYTGKTTVSGYNGPIEVTAGVSIDGIVTGVSVGGSDFSETAGLGAKVKDEAFTGEFDGLDAYDLDSIAVTSDGGKIDAVTSATFSSRYVSGAVREICVQIQNYIKKGGN